MKFFFTITIVLIFSVTFLYYLLNNQIFIPVDTFGNYNWLNIVVFQILSFLSVFSFLSLLIYSMFHLTKKNKERQTLMFMSLKISLIISLGLLVVLILNFFNILNILWGISILIVVLIFTFII